MTVGTRHPLRVGIAGYGIVGKRRRECCDRHPDLQVVAVCDRYFDGPGTMPDGVRHWRTYEELLAEDLDALVVCMTNDIAAEVVVAAMERGLHVLCEKPPGRNMADIERVVAAERLHPDVRLMYGFNHRYHESVQDALRIVRSGELGRIINMRGVYGKSKLITFNQPDWRAKREVAGGGVLLDQGIHMVDLMRLFGGEFDEVQSVVSNGHWGYDVEDNAYALMRSGATGVVAMINSSATQWRHQFHLDITLQRGGIVLRGILSGSKSYGAETMTVVVADPDRDNGDPRETLTTYVNDPSWDTEVAVWAGAIATGAPIEGGSATDALRTMHLVHQIYWADRTWRERYAIPDPGPLP
jgi:predicted dehydrogenase